MVNLVLDQVHGYFTVWLVCTRSTVSFIYAKIQLLYV